MSLKQSFDDQLSTIRQSVKRKSTLYAFVLKCIENYTKYMSDYSKKIDSIIKDISSNKSPDNFSSFFFAFREFFSNRKQHLDKTISELTEVQKQLNPFCSKWNQSDNQISKDIINAEKAFLKLINDFEQTKKTFIKTNMSCVNRLVKYEQNKTSPPQLASLDQQYKQIQNELTHASQIESKYQELQVECNLENDKYQESLKVNLRKYIDLDNDMSNAFKQAFKSIIKNEKESIMFELEKHEVNTRNDASIAYSDMNEDKSKYNVIEVPMKKIEPFQPSITHSTNVNKFEDEITYNVIKELKSKLTYVALDYNVEKEGIKLALTKVCKKILEGKDIYAAIQKYLGDEQEKLYSSLKQKEYHMHFLMYLNFKRAEGKFQLMKNSFIQLGSIMKYILNSIKGKEDNCEALRYCLILSQTYYFLNAKKERVYCIRYFEDMEVFKGKEFWKFFFEENISQEVAKLNKATDIEVKEKNNQLQNIVFSKILSFVHNMFELRNGKELVKEIVSIFCEKYQLGEEFVSQIMMMINDYVSEEKKEFDVEKDLEEMVENNEVSGTNKENEVKKEGNNEEKKIEEDNSQQHKQNENNIQDNNTTNNNNDNKQNESETQSNNINTNQNDNNVNENTISNENASTNTNESSTI